MGYFQSAIPLALHSLTKAKFTKSYNKNLKLCSLFSSYLLHPSKIFYSNLNRTYTKIIFLTSYFIISLPTSLSLTAYLSIDLFEGVKDTYFFASKQEKKSLRDLQQSFHNSTLSFAVWQKFSLNLQSS